MKKDNDTDNIVHEFLEIWQKQFSHISKDPEIIGNMINNFATVQKNYLKSFGKESDVEQNTSTDISDNAFNELRKLTNRIEYLEKRVAEFESRIKGES